MKPPSSVILTWDEPETNTRWYLHIGCDIPRHYGLCFVPLDDSPPPTEVDAECQHCCMVFPLLVARRPT